MFLLLHLNHPTENSKPSVAGEATVATEIDPRLTMADDETFGLSGVRTTPLDPRGEVTRTELDTGVTEIQESEKGPKPKPKGRFFMDVSKAGNRDFTIEKVGDKFFYVDKDKNRTNPLSPKK